MTTFPLHRCVIHPHHTKVGVCALCLRQRLLALQAEADDHCLPSPSSIHSQNESGLGSGLGLDSRDLPDAPLPENCTFQPPPPPLPTFLHRLKLKNHTIPPPSPDTAALGAAATMASSHDGAPQLKPSPNPNFAASRLSNVVTPRRSNASESADQVLNNTNSSNGMPGYGYSSNTIGSKPENLRFIHQNGANAANHGDLNLASDSGPSSLPSADLRGSHHHRHQANIPSYPSPAHPHSSTTAATATTHWFASLFHRGKKNKQSQSSKARHAGPDGSSTPGFDHIWADTYGGGGSVNTNQLFVPSRVSVDGSTLKSPFYPAKSKPHHWEEARASCYNEKHNHHLYRDMCTTTTTAAAPSSTTTTTTTTTTTAMPSSLGEELSTARLTFKQEQRKLIPPSPEPNWAQSGSQDIEIRLPTVLFERSRSCGSSAYNNYNYNNMGKNSNYKKNNVDKPLDCPSANAKRSSGRPAEDFTMGSNPKHGGAKDSRTSLGSYFSSPFRRSSANRKQAAVHHL